jgi:hypothetical protein
VRWTRHVQGAPASIAHGSGLGKPTAPLVSHWSKCVPAPNWQLINCARRSFVFEKVTLPKVQRSKTTASKLQVSIMPVMLLRVNTDTGASVELKVTGVKLQLVQSDNPSFAW